MPDPSSPPAAAPSKPPVAPFHYDDTTWQTVAAALPTSPLTPPGMSWSTVGVRRVPLIVGSSPTPKHAAWARPHLEWAITLFLRVEAKPRQRPIGELHAAMLTTKSRLVKQLQEAAASKEQIDTVVAIVDKVGRKLGPPKKRSGRPALHTRRWLCEILFYVWQQCGGEMDVSERSDLVRFILVAIEPVELMTADVAAKVARKLLDRVPESEPIKK
jgi:hypothetical protein